MAGLTGNQQIERRCADRAPCCEVVDRLRAADLARILDDVPEHHPAIEALRTTAARFAELHRYGNERTSPAS